MSLRSFQVHRAGPFAGVLRVPGDKSISHRAAILGGLAAGTTEVSGFLPSDDCLCTLAAMRAMGATVGIPEGEDPVRPTRLRVTGAGLKLAAPAGPVDCGNSGTAMRLLGGVLAAQGFASTLVGDASLSGRPMGRIIRPLGLMGAIIEGQGEKQTAPLWISGGKLHPICYEMPVASAQVKSAILLAGLFCDGTTTVIQPATTRDHTERLFAHFGLAVAVAGDRVSVAGPQAPVARDLRVPGAVEEHVLHLAELTRQAGLDGIVCSAADLRAIRQKLPPEFLYVTPGIQGPTTAAGSDQKRVYTPQAAIRDGASLLVVGRAITAAPDRLAAGRAILEDALAAL